MPVDRVLETVRASNDVLYTALAAYWFGSYSAVPHRRHSLVIDPLL